MKIVLALLCDFYAQKGRGSFLYKNRRSAYAPTTLITLASLVPPELKAEVEIYDEFIEDFDPHLIDADLVALSFTTPNANYAYEVSKTLRQRGITVVFGGYHTSLMPDEAQQHADACILGYAETTWPQLLRDFQNKQLKTTYKSDCTEHFKHLNVTRYDLLKKHKYYFPFSIEFTRSCINSCSFCVIHNLHNGQMYFRDISKAVEDIKRQKVKSVTILDSSPAEHPEYFREMCKALKDLKVEWYSNISFRSLQDESLIDLMAESGCRGVLLGFESLNQESLNEQHKSFNRVEKYKAIVEKFHKRKIFILGTFVFGFDADDPSVFDKTIKFVRESKIDVPNFSTLIPFPGTELFQTLESQGRIITKDWSKYDGKHAVFQPMNMSPNELLAGVKKAYKETFSLGSIINRTLLTPTCSFRNFSGNIALGIFNNRALK